MNAIRLICMAVSILPTAKAAIVNKTWSGGATGNWNTAGSWTPNGVPNNGADTYNVQIGTTSAVTVNGAFTIRSLNILAGASATIAPSQSLTWNTDSTVNGTLNIGQDGSFSSANLRYTANLALTGTGAVELRGTSYIAGTSSTLRLTNGLTLHALNGNAGFESPITNNGLMDFEGTGTHNFNLPDATFFNAGTLKSRSSAIVNIAPLISGFDFNNSGTVDVDNGRVEFFSGVNCINTGTMRASNGGLLQTWGSITNTAGSVQLINGGKLTLMNFSTFTGGSISGAGGLVEPMNTLTLQGGGGADTLNITDTEIRIASASTPVTVANNLALAGAAKFVLRSLSGFPSGGRMNVNGNVSISGTGTIQFGSSEIANTLTLAGSTANDTLTLGSGVTLATGSSAGSGSITVKTVNSSGPMNINSPNFSIGATSTTSVGGAVHVFPNARITANGKFNAKGPVTLDSGAMLTGVLGIDGATASGTGTIRPTTLSIDNTNSISSIIETGATTLTVNGSAAVNGSGKLFLNQGSNNTTTLAAGSGSPNLTTGVDFDVEIPATHTLTSNVPWQFAGDILVNGGVLNVAGGDLTNNGLIQLSNSAQMTLSKSIASGSSGSVAIASGCTLTINGATTVGGSLSGAGAVNFNGTTPVTVSSLLGTGTVTIASGSIVAVSGAINQAPPLAVNGSLSFNGGVTTLGTTTINGASALLAVTGNTTASGTLTLLGGGTHSGAGATSVSGLLTLTNGKLDGRTLVANGATTLGSLTLLNNATFVNNGTATFSNTGGAGSVSGTGTVRNQNVLTQPNTGATNTIGSSFEQTAAGTMNLNDPITLNGGSPGLTGQVNLSTTDSKLTFSASGADRTYEVPATISGIGTIEATGNLATGIEPTVHLTGGINLTGSASATRVKNGAVAIIGTIPAPALHGSQIESAGGKRNPPAIHPPPVLGRALEVSDAEVRMGNSEFTGSILFPEAKLFKGVVVSGDGHVFEASCETLETGGTDTAPSKLDTVKVAVSTTCTMNPGPLDLKNGSTLSILDPCTMQMFDGSTCDSSTGDGLLVLDGDLVLPFLCDGTIKSDFECHGDITVSNNATLVVFGDLDCSGGMIDTLGNGAITISGACSMEDSTINLNSGSGTFVASNVNELHHNAITANSGSTAQITIPNPANRANVDDIAVNLTDASQVLFNGVFHSSGSINANGRGGLFIESLSADGAECDIAPGNSAGHLNLTGNLTPAAGSTVTVEIGGTTQSTQYDLLSFTGVLNVTSVSLHPRFISNFQNTITPANTFTVIETTQPIVGTFFNTFNGRVMAADFSGSFAVTLTNGNTRVVLSDFLANDFIDSDGDGMTDEFEKLNFGNATAGVSGQDIDGDGQTNFKEFVAGTRANDGTDVLRMKTIARQGNNVVITFEAEPDRTYRVKTGVALNAFPTLVQTFAPSTTRVTRTVTHTGGATDPRRFYQLEVSR